MLQFLLYADVAEKQLNGYDGFISVLDLKMLRNLGDCILEWVSHTLIPTLLSMEDFLDERQTLRALLQMLLSTFHNHMNQQVG